jgi:hypothetical protein
MSRPARSLAPRNGHTLVVGIVARISGCANQKDVSLDDQVDHARQEVAELFDGPVEERIIKTRGKGERVDRPELAELEAMIRSRELDLLLAEDLGRIVRGTEAERLCGIAVDHGVRVIVPNDGIDTDEESWPEDVIAACRDHVSHNRQTSKRLKHKLMNRFKKSGGSVPLPIYGYVKPEGAETYADWRVDPAATPIYRELFRRLLASPNCTAAAEWLNASGVPTGPFARVASWDGAMVRRIVRNPVLKGTPGRGFKVTIKYNETGQRIAVPNPDGPRFRDCPHLAHVDAELWDDVNALLEANNAGLGRKKVGGVDPRARVPRKRTRFPGQHARCHYCGRLYVWGGNGLAGNLMCNGSRLRRCWNSIGFDGALAASKAVEAVLTALAGLEGFDDQLRALAEGARRACGDGQAAERAELERAEAELARKRGNLADAVAEFGPLPHLKEKHAELEERGREQARRRRELDRLRVRPPELPASAAELRRLFEDKARGLAVDSPEFGDLLRLVVPEFRVHLVRLVDGGHPAPRARLGLDLAGLAPDARFVPGFGEALRAEAEIDLFEPPQRERIRAEAVRLESEGLEQREIARRLPEGRNQAAVFHALALDREMRRRDLASPYEALHGPPDDYPKLRRHKHPAYVFEPEEGYRPPEL